MRVRDNERFQTMCLHNNNNKVKTNKYWTVWYYLTKRIHNAMVRGLEVNEGAGCA